MSKWFNLYSFDVMGDLAFGTSYNMLQTGELHWAIKTLNEGMTMAGLNLPIWLFRLVGGSVSFGFNNLLCYFLLYLLSNSQLNSH